MAKQTAPQLQDFWDIPQAELLDQLKTTTSGLSAAEAGERLGEYGPNSLVKESRFTALISFFRLFANPLVIILLGASAVSLGTGDQVGGSIIVCIVMLSVVLNFCMEFQARHAVEALRKQVASQATVMRDGKEQELPVADLVPGDIIHLSAGDLVPADARLLEVKDLHVHESALTGESLPVDKFAADLTGDKHGVADATNAVFMGTDVHTGIATAVIVSTGGNTAFGAIAKRLSMKPPETEFDRGTRTFGTMLTRVIMLLVICVLLVNIHFHRSLLESLLFSVALAVGLTPELMPMIITVTLALGARRMTKRKVVVKQLAAIEDFGSMEILCSDKTGTLTEGEIVLDKHVDVQGKDDDSVMQLIYVNSFFEAGIKSPLDDAILKHDHPSIDDYGKEDEIPFDFIRKRLSVVVNHGGEHLMITKGDVESVLDVCKSVTLAGSTQPFDAAQRAAAEETYKKLSEDGYRTLGVAIRNLDKTGPYSSADESDMTLAGFAAFLDPPKEGIGDVLKALNKDGISVVIMTGDNQYITQKIARDVGLAADKVFTGSQVGSMDDAALAVQAEQGAIFARVSPEQKNRVILALKARGHVVGYMGDGINDAPSLHTADVGISVVNGVDVAKDAAKIILLEKDLGVLNDGVLEGRRSFANIMKYIIMGTSSNFGNMFSMAAASIFLKNFLPMLPTQILLNNLLYDVSQISIPTDNVDEPLLRKPKRWKIDFIRQFMVIIGPISSMYDFITFGLLLYGFHAWNNASLFQTGWFVESVATQTLVVFVIRTAANPFKSHPSRPLLVSVLTIVAVAVILPYTPLGALMKFTPLPAVLMGAIGVLTVTYMLLVQAVKVWFYKRHSLL